MHSFDPRSTDARLLYEIPQFDAVRSSTLHSNEAVRNWRSDAPPEIKRVVLGVKTTAQRLFLQYDLRNIRLSSMRGFILRRLFTVTTVLALVWILVIHNGERGGFKDKIASCEWNRWESWSSDANPHHLIFVADPQLIDPHTYPGRPWPLSTLTIQQTDLYLRRAYTLIQQRLYPDTIFFLGDLFDGGREWATTEYQSPKQEFRKYKDGFWFKEYVRFQSIFNNIWRDYGADVRPGQAGRKLITSLPGNHDLGFAAGVQTSVRRRFNIFFGEGNRIDVVGNHTFVSVDTVSLSALGAEAGTDEELYRPTLDFLDEVEKKKMRAIAQELRGQSGLPRNVPYRHAAVETKDLARDFPPAFNMTQYEPEFPTILLTHVPLYRDSGTPCGPLREHWPPTSPPNGQTGPVIPDHRNAIAVQAGYQYQNVLTPEVSKLLTDKIGKVQYAFSGDDHDYCELVHMGYSGTGSGLREITVKSMSWAMGVRKPGFLMVSLWNQVDQAGRRVSTGTAKLPTMQTHLCLLPDQLGVFIRYGELFGFSLVVLLIRAILIMKSPSRSTFGSVDAPLLPISSTESEKAAETYRRKDAHKATASDSSTSSDNGNLHVRNATTRTKNAHLSPFLSSGFDVPTQDGKYSLPLVAHAGYFGACHGDKDQYTSTTGKARKPWKGWGLFWAEFTLGLHLVGIPAFGYYFWLLWNG